MRNLCLSSLCVLMFTSTLPFVAEAGQPIPESDLYFHGGSLREVTTQEPLNCRETPNGRVTHAFPRGDLISVVLERTGPAEDDLKAVVRRDSSNASWFLVYAPQGRQCFIKSDSDYTASFGYRLGMYGEFETGCLSKSYRILIHSEGDSYTYRVWNLDGPLHTESLILRNGQREEARPFMDYRWQGQGGYQYFLRIPHAFDHEPLHLQGRIDVEHRGKILLSERCSLIMLE